MTANNIEQFLQNIGRVEAMQASPIETPFLRVRTAKNGTYTTTYSTAPSTLNPKLIEQKGRLEGNIAALANEYGLIVRPHLEIVPHSFSPEHASGIMSIEGIEFNNSLYVEMSDDELELHFRERQRLNVREMPEFYSGQPILGCNHKNGSTTAHISVNTHLMQGHFWYNGHKRFNTFDVASDEKKFYLNERMAAPRAKLGDGALTHFLEMLQ